MGERRVSGSRLAARAHAYPRSMVPKWAPFFPTYLFRIPLPYSLLRCTMRLSATGQGKSNIFSQDISIGI